MNSYKPKGEKKNTNKIYPPSKILFLIPIAEIYIRDSQTDIHVGNRQARQKKMQPEMTTTSKFRQSRWLNTGDSITKIPHLQITDMICVAQQNLVNVRNFISYQNEKITQLSKGIGDYTKWCKPRRKMVSN